MLVYYGSPEPFSPRSFQVGQPGVGGALSWRYRTGRLWAPLGASEDLLLEDTRACAFELPADRAPRMIGPECAGDLDYLRASTARSQTVIPLLDRVRFGS